MWGLQGATPCVFHFRVDPQMPHPPVVTRIIPSHSCGDPELGAPHCKLVPSFWTVVLDRAGWQPVEMGPRREIWEWGGSPYTGTLRSGTGYTWEEEGACVPLGWVTSVVLCPRHICSPEGHDP